MKIKDVVACENLMVDVMKRQVKNPTALLALALNFKNIFVPTMETYRELQAKLLKNYDAVEKSPGVWEISDPIKMNEFAKSIYELQNNDIDALPRKVSLDLASEFLKTGEEILLFLWMLEEQ